ncbi:putative Protein of unknown function (DUF423) [Trypanosoma vivax]|nr:membrane protein [Trypanosoma vivax]KAH8609641.1 putative Protein of unknown function (DUF423) [Trypanosoma vivax]KAH8609713.1 putative Protein of unknown function (DUF423) [Trypanosoma vivax]
MSGKRQVKLTIAGVTGLVGVLASAYGSHSSSLPPDDQRRLWNTAAQFNILHAVALLGIYAVSKSQNTTGYATRCLCYAFYFLAAGTLLFCGTAYVIFFGAPSKVFGPLMPIGGVTLIIGWTLIAAAGIFRQSDDTDELQPICVEEGEEQ